VTKILDGFNPCGTNMDPTADPRLQSFYLDRHPGHDQRVHWLSREDCSVEVPSELKAREEDAFGANVHPIDRRACCGYILQSFCPLKTVNTLVARGVPFDFDGVIAFDHELPAWCSSMHRMAYDGLQDAINAVYPLADVYEYGGLATDFVRNYSGRGHEVGVMDAAGKWSPCAPMPHLYVPDAAYIKNAAKWQEMCFDNVVRWKRVARYDPIIAVNPFIEHTQKVEGDYTSGELVPVEAMTIIVRAINSIGASVCIWGAAYDERQGNRFVEAVEQVMIPAVEAAEKGAGK
jgi:hypothetical protein